MKRVYKPRKFKPKVDKKKQNQAKAKKPPVIETSKVVDSTVKELKQETRGIVSFLLGKQWRIIRSKEFLIFFIQSFLMTGILLLLILVLGTVIDLNSSSLLKLNDTYSVHEFPYLEKQLFSDSKPLAYIIYEKDSRAVVSSKNIYNRFSPASAAKIMTALVALEHFSPSDILSAQVAKDPDASKMGLTEGETITVKNLLYGLMLPSGNDAAYTLAVNYPGGYTSFINRMNEKAKELKLLNTFFTDPAGYEDDNFTTAFDLARLASHALNNSLIQEIVKTKSIVVYDTTGSHIHSLSNLNRLLNREGVTGIKTGFTEEAEGVLVTSYVQNGKTYVVVVLKSEDRFADTEMILDEIKNVRLVSY